MTRPSAVAPMRIAAAASWGTISEPCGRRSRVDAWRVRISTPGRPSAQYGSPKFGPTFLPTPIKHVAEGEAVPVLARQHGEVPFRIVVDVIDSRAGGQASRSANSTTKSERRLGGNEAHGPEEPGLGIPNRCVRGEHTGTSCGQNAHTEEGPEPPFLQALGDLRKRRKALRTVGSAISAQAAFLQSHDPRRSGKIRGFNGRPDVNRVRLRRGGQR